MSKFHVFSGLRRAFEYRNEPESMRRLADAYWRLLILIVLAAAVLTILYGLSQLAAVITIAQSQSIVVTQHPLPLDRDTLENALDALHERQAVSDGDAPATTISNPASAAK